MRVDGLVGDGDGGGMMIGGARLVLGDMFCEA